MKQPNVPNYTSFAVDPVLGSNFHAFLGSVDFLSQENHQSPHRTDLDAINFWSRVYDLRGGMPVVPGSLKDKRAEDTLTARAVEDAIVAERNRLARELHDAVTQTLFAASLIAEVLPELWDMDEVEARKSTDELRPLTRGALAEMRTLLFELRPAALSQAHLSDLLKQLSESVMGRQRLPICLDISGDCDIPCDIKVEIYRIVQESLNNTIKYAHADRVDIKVRLEADRVHMEIKDNGIGFDPTCVKPTSLGLRIMRERAEAIHAQFQVFSQSGLGTTVNLAWNKQSTPQSGSVDK